jgi:hypothetical protein
MKNGYFSLFNIVLTADSITDVLNGRSYTNCSDEHSKEFIHIKITLQLNANPSALASSPSWTSLQNFYLLSSIVFSSRYLFVSQQKVSPSSHKPFSLLLPAEATPDNKTLLQVYTKQVKILQKPLKVPNVAIPFLCYVLKEWYYDV